MVYKENYVMEAYKIIPCIAKVNQEQLFSKSHNTAVRDNPMELSDNRSKAKKRKTDCLLRKILLHCIAFHYMEL